MIRPVEDFSDYTERIKGCLYTEYGLYGNLDFDPLIESYMSNIKEFYNNNENPEKPEDVAHWIYENEENG